MRYIVQNFGATDPAPKEVPSLKLARAEAKSRLGVRMLGRGAQSVKREGALEAYKALSSHLIVAGISGVEIRVAQEEPFCACGRPVSRCDGSRARCHKRVAQEEPSDGS